MPFIVVQMGGFECTLVLLHMIARSFSFLLLDFLPLSIDWRCADRTASLVRY
jgi:hypothetical protein